MSPFLDLEYEALDFVKNGNGNGNGNANYKSSTAKMIKLLILKFVNGFSKNLMNRSQER